ncbi:MAG: hypothetical protein KJ884_00575, partial [Gammaproteobacteria bacterium]|nr:hypothetical protein [Gammaproteobacteria bacterium]
HNHFRVYSGQHLAEHRQLGILDLYLFLQPVTEHRSLSTPQVHSYRLSGLFLQPIFAKSLKNRPDGTHAAAGLLVPRLR